MASQRVKKSESSGSKSSSEGRHGRSGGKQANGARRPDRQMSARGSDSGRQREDQSGGNKNRNRGEEAGVMRRTTEEIKDAGSKTLETVKQHPLTTALIGAGVAAGITVLAVRAFRASSQSQTEPGMEMDEDQEAQDMGEEEGGGEEEGSEEDEGGEEDADEDDSRRGFLGRAKNALGSVRDRMGGAADSLREGTSGLGSLWEDHPLAVGTGILALGVAAGMMLPTTRPEKQLFGKASGSLGDKVRSAGRELLEQGKDVVGRVISEAGETVRQEVEREGLSPDKLGRKVRRIAGRVKEAISNAAE